MSFPHKGRSNANAGPLASVPYVRQGTAPPAQLYPAYRYSATTSASDLNPASNSGGGNDAVNAQQVDGIPDSLFPRVPLAPGTREKRAVEEQLLLRQRMRLSAFYLDRSAALSASRKRPPASSSPQPIRGVLRTSNSGTLPANDDGIDAAVVVMSEALPAARALIPPELLETGSVHHDSHGKPSKKRARTSSALTLPGAGEDIDAEGIFSSLAQKESQAGEDGDADGEKKGDEEEEKSDLEEGSDAENADEDSDGDGGDYDMGQYGSDGDDYDDYGDDGGDGDDDYGRDDD